MGWPPLICRSLRFTGPHQVELVSERVGAVERGKLLVASRLSAISAGTELLLFRNQLPPGVPLDQTIPDLQKPFAYPVKYGYAVVGEVVDVGSGISSDWAGKRIFALHPHESHFMIQPEEVVVLPDEMSWEDAVFLPFVETAVNFLMDGRPGIGEQVAVFGQGVIGLLTTALLGRMPLARLITLDRYPFRRRFSMELGAHVSLDPATEAVIADARESVTFGSSYEGADLVYEVSGNPEVLNQAVAVAGFAGRVVVGSWYGQKKSSVDLGGYFHRSRITIISSQVSTVTPGSSGGWTKGRRIQVALDMVSAVRPSRLITNSFTLDRAQEAYELLENNPEEVIQVVFTY